MSSEIVVICPALSPGSGGLADYTIRVVREWRDAASLRFIVPASADPAGLSSPEYVVETVERNRAALREKLPPRDGKVLLQYSAYGFDHFGYPRWLLQALAEWKASSGGLLVVMLHEIWTFWPVLNKNYLVQQLHRRDLRNLVARADAVFTSTASQAEHLRELSPGAEVEVLPVGANITPGASGEGRQPGMAVLFGLQAARLRTLRTMKTDLEALASMRLLTELVTIGEGNTQEGNEEEAAILDALPLRRNEMVGALTEEKISQLFSRATFGISAQDELSITKSGTFMAYAASGLNILSPLGDPTKPEPLCWLTKPDELLRGLSVEEFESRSKKLRTWQERTSSWPIIAERFARALLSKPGLAR